MQIFHFRFAEVEFFEFSQMFSLNCSNFPGQIKHQTSAKIQRKQVDFSVHLCITTRSFLIKLNFSLRCKIYIQSRTNVIVIETESIIELHEHSDFAFELSVCI